MSKNKNIVQKKILVTGGSGLLGTAIKKVWPNACYPTSSECNITNRDQIEKYVIEHKITHIFHAAAFTSPPKVDENPLFGIEANIIGTANVAAVALQQDCTLIYISTDYVYPGLSGPYDESSPVYPVNKYAWSKLGGECAVHLVDKSLIIRTTFGPDEFPYDKAFADQWTSRVSVSEVVQLMTELVKVGATGIYNVGGARKTVKEFAIQLGKSNVQDLYRNDVSFVVPADTSMNVMKMKKVLAEK